MISLLQTLAIFLIKLIFELYLFAIIFRLLLQFFGANYFNPICQFLIKITDPLVKPLRFIPRIKAVDLSLITIFLILEYLKILIIFLVLGSLPNFLYAFLWAILLSFNSLVNFYFYAIILYVIMSWLAIAQARFSQQQPLAQALYIVVTPVLKIIRKIVPSIAHIDFSPLIALVILEVFSIILLFALTGLGAPRVII